MFNDFVGGIHMIEAWQVREVLRPRFGSALMDEPGAADRTAGLLNSYASYKDTFADMASRVEDTLFNMLYDHLGPSMTVRIDNGATRRIHTSELKDAADDVMGVLFDQMKVYSVNYDAIHTYCIESGSASAMRILYLRYRDFLPESERKIIARIIRDSRPKEDWESWLNPADL